MTTPSVSPLETQTFLPVRSGDLATLHTALARRADDAGLLDVVYRTVDTPVGALLLASSRRGLVRVAFEREGFDHVLEVLASAIGSRLLEAPDRLAPVATELTEYFRGRRRRFDVALDLSLSSGFRSVVQRYLPQIDYGTVQSYTDVAAHVGNPRAVRAVGTACATNPLPIVVPCHRVVRADGSPGSYRGGSEVKAALLRLEQVA